VIALNAVFFAGHSAGFFIFSEGEAIYPDKTRE
jgi:hypothetical protein